MKTLSTSQHGPDAPAAPAVRGRLRAVGSLALAHPAWAAFAVALVVRLAAVAVIVLTRDGVLIPDEHLYIDLATFVSDGRGANAWAPGYGPRFFGSTATFMVPLTALFTVFGPHRVLAQLMSALVGAAVAAVTVRLAGDVVRRGFALGAGLAVAVWPSQVLWSSVVLRESFVWAALALVALAVIRAADASTRRDLARWGAVGTVALLALAHLRGQTSLMAVWLVPVAMVLLPGRRRLLRVGVALCLALVIPITVDQGVGGWTLLESRLPALDRTRVNSAAGASSSFIPRASTSTTTTGGLTQHGSGLGGTTATTANPPTTVTPNQVLASDGAVYDVEEGFNSNLHQLPRGLLAAAFRPVVGASTGSTELELSAVENLLWYGLYVAALAGLWLRRRALRHLLFPTLLFLGLLVQIALIQGNLGTAFRHRGQGLWALVVVAAVTAQHVWDRCQLRRV